MSLSKKGFSFLVHYVLAILIANLVVGMVSLLFKIFLITVQGPTMLSWVLEIAAYYTSISFAFFYLFRSFGEKQAGLIVKGIYLAAGMIFILQTLIVFTAEWPTVWLMTTGSSSLAHFLYTGGGYLKSLREIPRFNYFVAWLIEDLCFLIFSSFGYSIGSHRQKNPQNNKQYPFKEIIK